MAITYSTDWAGIANNTLLKDVPGWTTDGTFAADQNALKVSTAVVPAGALAMTTTSNGCLASRDSGSDSGYVELTYLYAAPTTGTINLGPAVRCVSRTNFIGVRIVNNNLQTFHRTGSTTYNTIGSSFTAINIVSGTKIALKVDGNTLRVLKDGTELGTRDITGIQSGSRVGIWAQIASAVDPLMGFTEIGTLASESISITSIKDREVNSIQGATFAKNVSGTYTGAVPVSVQYKVTQFVSGTIVQDWATLDAAPSGGTFSGVINLAAGQYYKVEVRYSDKPAVNNASGRLGVGYLFEFAGQSNTVNKFSTGSGDATPLDNTAIFDTAGLTWAIPTTQHVAHWLNALSTQFGCVVGAYTTAVGSTSITQHLSGGSNYAARTAALTAVGGKLNGLYWGQGEGDVGAAGLYQSRLGELYTDILTRTGQTSSALPLYIAQLGRNEGGTTGSSVGWQGVRSAQTSFVAATANTYISHQTMDLPMADDLHRNAAGSKMEMLRSVETVLKVMTGAGSSGRGPIPISISLSGSDIAIMHDLNGSTSITLPVSSQDGYQASSDDFGTILPISSISTSGSTITLTLTSAPSGTVKVRSQQGQDPDNAKMPTGSKTYNGQPVMVEPIVNAIEPTAGTVTASSAFAMPQFAVDASASASAPTFTASASVTMPQMAVAGVATDTPPTFSASVAATMPQMQVQCQALSVASGVIASINMTMPQMSIAAIASDTSPAISASFSFTMPQFSVYAVSGGFSFYSSIGTHIETIAASTHLEYTL